MRYRSLSKGNDDGLSWQTAGNKCSLIGGSDSKAEQQEEQSVMRDVSSFTRVRSNSVLQLVLAAQIQQLSEWQISNFQKLLLKLVQRVFNWFWNNLIPKPLYEEQTRESSRKYFHFELKVSQLTRSRMIFFFSWFYFLHYILWLWRWKHHFCPQTPLKSTKNQS